MSAYESLRALCGAGPKVVVNTADLSAMLDEYDALRAACQPKRKAAKKSEVLKVAAPGEGLPVWLPIEAWNAFLEMRKKIKKPATEYAQKLLLKKLEKFQAQGVSVTEVLEQSITSGWQDVYALKDGARGFGYETSPLRPNRLTRQQQQALSSEEALRRLDGIPAFDPNTIDMEQSHGTR